MQRELDLLYPLYPAGAAAPISLETGTSTASTTLGSPSSNTTTIVSSGRFVDSIVANRDVRVLRDTSGKSLLLYGYADRETLIIARNEASFSALLTRLQAKAK